MFPMKKKIWTSFTLSFLLFFLTGTVWSNPFSSSVTIQNQGTLKYKAVRLNAKIINIANPDLSDLLLLNPKKETVPYFIHPSGVDKNLLESLLPAFVLHNEEKLTRISLHGLKNCKLYDIQIETNDMFKRTCSFGGREKVLYQLKFQTNQTQDLTIPLDGMIVTGDAEELIINNNDDQPIQVTRITVRRYVDSLIFDGSNADYFVLKFGNPMIMQPPRYDISSYRDSIIREGFDILAVGDIIQEPLSLPPPKPKKIQWLFNTILGLIIILIGFVLLTRIKKSD